MGCDCDEDSTSLDGLVRTAPLDGLVWTAPLDALLLTELVADHRAADAECAQAACTTASSSGGGESDGEGGDGEREGRDVSSSVAASRVLPAIGDTAARDADECDGRRRAGCCGGGDGLCEATAIRFRSTESDVRISDASR